MAVAEEELLDKLRTLPDNRKQEVADFIEFLVQRDKAKTPRRSLLGALSHLNQQFTAEDLKEARREMWGEYMEEDKK